LFVTDEEAAEIYARACRSWYGAKAKSVVKAKIRALRAKGDHKGAAVWKRVQQALERKEQDPTAKVGGPRKSPDPSAPSGDRGT
jgi:hypothetical protein